MHIYIYMSISKKVNLQRVVLWHITICQDSSITQHSRTTIFTGLNRLENGRCAEFFFFHPLHFNIHGSANPCTWMKAFFTASVGRGCSNDTHLNSGGFHMLEKQAMSAIDKVVIGLSLMALRKSRGAGWGGRGHLS